MKDNFYGLLDAALSEARSEALRQFKNTDENYRSLSERSVLLSQQLLESLPGEAEKLFDDYIDCMAEIHSIELNREYREGINHCLQLIQYLGINISGDTDIGEKIAKILLEQTE